MTTALRQRIVIAQSLTSLSWLAPKSLAFILYLVFKRRHEMNLHFCSFPYSWILLFHPMCKNKRSVPLTILSGGPPSPPNSPSETWSCSCGVLKPSTVLSWRLSGIFQDLNTRSIAIVTSLLLWRVKHPLLVHQITVFFWLLPTGNFILFYFFYFNLE